MSKNELTKTAEQTTALATYGEDAGAGITDLPTDVLALPFLQLLQAMSPQVTEGDASFNPDARPGDLFNSVTFDIYSGKVGVILQPVNVSYRVIEWLGEGEDRGKKVAEHMPESDVVVRARAEAVEWNCWCTPEGNTLEPTYLLHALLYTSTDDTSPSPVVLSITRTKISQFKKLVTRLSMIAGKPPLFANRIRVTSISETNSSDQRYFNLAYAPAVGKSFLESLLPPTDPRYALGKSFRDVVTK